MTPKGARNIRKLTVLQALALEPGWVSASAKGQFRLKWLRTDAI